MCHCGDGGVSPLHLVNPVNHPDDVIFPFLVYAPTSLRPDDVIFSIYRLRPSTLRPDDVIIFDDVTYLIYATKIN